MRRLPLAKLHATGNDFLVWSWLDRDAEVRGMLGPQVAALCDRRRGIGADGLIVVQPGDDGAQCRMQLFNADGNIAEVSGNGLRCLAWVAHRKGVGDGTHLVVDTAAGRRDVDLTLDEDGDVGAATVEMGAVTFEPAAIPLDAPSAFGVAVAAGDTTYHGDAAGMGNPHLVVLVDDPAAVAVATHGPILERDPRFPKRTNVEFVAVAAPDELTMRVWERGVGETLSCGTGACAAAAVAHRRGLVANRVTVHVPGGALKVEIGETIRLGGPVVHVFDTVVDLDEFAGNINT
jgi:diaminopimelate epimerase